MRGTLEQRTGDVGAPIFRRNARPAADARRQAHVAVGTGGTSRGYEPCSMKKILVAISPSETSNVVVAHALELATAQQAEVRLLRIGAPTVQEDLFGDVIVAPAMNAEVVCTVARENDADVVVVDGEDRDLLDDIVRRIDRPLYVVRGRATTSLRREHARIEHVSTALLDAHQESNWTEVRRQWNRLEPALRDHMENEEAQLLPRFREFDSNEADALLADHDDFRRVLGILEAEIDLETASHDLVASLVDRLRAHASREERSFYPWIERRSSGKSLSSNQLPTFRSTSS